jgi:chemotaxis protein methyltransferase CheR
MSISQSDFEHIRYLVRRHAGITVEENKRYLAEARLSALARHEGFASIQALVARVKADGPDGLVRKVVESMTTNETSFFRDVAPFDALRTEILPELCRSRAATRRLNIWSAACSSGQEPYSIAMMIHEHFPELLGWSLRILATDLSTEMIARARRGVYSQLDVSRGLPAPYLIKYFRRDGLDWELSEPVRRMVEFRQMNLSAPMPTLEPMDVILLRNVLIYFDQESKKSLVTQ